MTARRRTDPAAGEAAVNRWRQGDTDRATLAVAVRHTLDLMVQRAPGNSLELRVPPFAAVQCVPGPRHTRGTPGSVVETDAGTWLALATGALAWGDAVASGRVRASGERGDLSHWLPLGTVVP
ncbi:MAG TPA: sterol carrier family protein [Actinomycetales bacterium]|nr:sterol carrier family protein [Actinomycetales bacterium]